MNIYTLELSFQHSETGQLTSLSRTINFDGPIYHGNQLLVNDEWFRVGIIVNDIDNNNTILHLDKVVLKEEQFGHTIRVLKLKGWKIIGASDDHHSRPVGK